MRVCQSLWGILSLVIALTSTSARADDVRWETVAVGSGKLAVPKGWRDFDGIQPRMVIYRQGDGIGVPKVDETDAAGGPDSCAIGVPLAQEVAGATTTHG